MNKTKFINKVKEEINEKYNKVCNKKELEKKYKIKYIDNYMNKESKLNDLKEMKDFKNDVLKIENIMIRNPIEDDIYKEIDDNFNVICLEVPEVVYECLIIKSTNDNKYYKLSLTDFKEEYLKEMIKNKDLIMNNKRKHYYIIDIKDNIEYDAESDMINYKVILN